MKKFIKENIKTYLILTIIFFIGLTLGVIFVNNANETQASQISGYINNFINSIKENYQISTKELLKNSIIKVLLTMRIIIHYMENPSVIQVLPCIL